MKILFVGVFDQLRKSTNNSQLVAFNKLCSVAGYDYRDVASRLGYEDMSRDLINKVKKRNFDLVVFSKCNNTPHFLFEEATSITKTCLWFMDPLGTYNLEMREKTQLVNYFCCDKKNVLHEALGLNANSFQVCEGYDEFTERPRKCGKEYDVSFIGNIYGDRLSIINNIDKKVSVIANAYGENHSWEVSKTKINLNFCTNRGASDRVYKVLAAEGFLLTDDWEGRNDYFVTGKDIATYIDAEDLNEKIEYYLKHEDKRNKIALHGAQTVKKLSRSAWAQKILEICNG